MNDSPTPHTQPPHQAGSPWALSSIVVAAGLAVVAMSVVNRGPQTDFADAALGKGAVSIFAQRDGNPIHASTYGELPSLLEGVKNRNADSSVLWLGNSQLHAVNQATAQDEPASAKVHDALAPSGIDLVAVSFPNANLQEHYVALAYLAPRIDKLSAIVLPVVFDDLRETGVREDLLPMLSDAALAELLSKTEIGLLILQQRVESELEEKEETNSDLAGLRDTFQERTETFLNGWLEQNWSLWAARKEARGKMFLKLYEFRNFVFNITPQSKRRQIAPRYNANMDALRASLDITSNANLPVLLYVVPLRTDVETPYVEEEYARFKQEVETLCDAYPSVVFENYEKVVPAEYWGVKAGTSISGGQELDFMHFQEPGHRLLAEEVGQALRRIIMRSATN